MVGGVRRQSRGYRSACTRIRFSCLRFGTTPTKVVSGKHIIFTHFPRDRHFDVCLRTRMTRTPGRRQDALEKQYLEQKSLEVTESSARRANLETITDTQSWYKIFSLRGFQSYPCRTKNFSGDGKEFKKVFRAVVGILANHVLIFHGIIELRRPRSETKGIAEREWHAEYKKERLLCSCNQAWKKNVGLILYGMPLLSAKCPRPPGSRENAI